MPRGSKTKYTAKQRRQAHHIEDTAKKRGNSTKRAGQMAYATIHKEEGGGKANVTSTSGRRKSRTAPMQRKRSRRSGATRTSR